MHMYFLNVQATVTDDCCILDAFPRPLRPPTHQQHQLRGEAASGWDGLWAEQGNEVREMRRTGSWRWEG